MTKITMPIRIVAMMILPHGHLRFGGGAVSVSVSVCGSLLVFVLLVVSFSATEEFVCGCSCCIIVRYVADCETRYFSV